MVLREFHSKSLGFIVRGLLLTVLAAGLLIAISILLQDAINSSPFWSNALSKFFIFAICIINISSCLKMAKFILKNKADVVTKTEFEKMGLSIGILSAYVYGLGGAIMFAYACIRLILG